MVLRVDPDKGYIDLSRRKAKIDEGKICEKKYKQAKKVHNVMKQTAAMLNEDLESLYKRSAWRLYEKYESAYEVFKAAVENPEAIKQLGLDEKTYDTLMKNI